MSRVLIVCGDRVARGMAGPAIRCWEMARVLSARGHEVRLSAPYDSDLEPSDFELFRATNRVLGQQERWADVVVVQGMVVSNYPALARTRKHLVVDLYDPFTIENLEMNAELPSSTQVHHYWPTIATQIVQLRIGDFFLCATDRQRDLWLGALMATNRVNPLTAGQDRLMRRLLALAPFGLSDVPPEHSGTPAVKGVLPGISEGDCVAIWAGGVYNWFDPLSLIRAWPAVLKEVPRARLLFMGIRHPNPGIPVTDMSRRAIALAEELHLRDAGVTINTGWVPYERRQDFLLEAEIGVSTHSEHLETRYSFRTRFLDYIWAGLPWVATEGDAFADWATVHGTGLVVPYGDVGALSTAVVSLLGDRARREAVAARVRDQRDVFRWDHVLRPLVEYCAEPWYAQDIVGHKNTERVPGLRSPLQSPPGLIRRTLWFRKQEGTVAVTKRAVRKLARTRSAHRKPGSGED